MFKNITSWSRAFRFGHRRIASTARKSSPKTSQRLQSATTIPFDNTSLVTPPPIVPMIPTLIIKSKENNHRRDSNQAQEEAMNNNHRAQEEDKFWAEVMSEIEGKLATTHTTGAFDGLDIPSGNDYLEMLANFDLKSSTIDSLNSITSQMTVFMIHGADPIEFGRGRSLASCTLYDGSLNSEEIPPDAEILNCLVRTITVVLHSGLQISFNVLVLGRLSVNHVPTYWIVVLDEEKHLWALRAAGVDKEEVDDDDDWMEDPRWPAPQYDEQKDLFGADLPVVRLCSLASLQHFRKSGQQFSPEPYYGAKSWTSTYALVKAPATAAAEDS